MQYMGGKSRIAGRLAALMLCVTTDRAVYVEPFVGAGSVAALMAPQFKRAILSYAAPDLIMLWQALQRGWEPPRVVTREEYEALRHAKPSALRAFAGYGCSFGGKWFGGYAGICPPHRGHAGCTYAGHSAGSLLRKRQGLHAAEFSSRDYRDTEIPGGAVVYLDPPYDGTTGYSTGRFDHAAFWAWAGSLTHATVFVSEYTAPPGWVPLWNPKPQASLKATANGGTVPEHLWVKRGGG
jgi:DNA adenine methylase